MNDPIRSVYAELQNLLPGYLFTMLELFEARSRDGDSMYLELETLIQGLDEEGELEDDTAQRALALLEALPVHRKLHNPQTLIELLSELYVVCGALGADSQTLDQIMAGIEGDSLPHKSLLPCWIPMTQRDYDILTADHDKLLAASGGDSCHPLAASLQRVEAALEAFRAGTYRAPDV